MGKVTQKNKGNGHETKFTICGAPIEPIHRSLPYQTTSICPECKVKVTATLFEKFGKVYMEKSCPQHGHFQDLIFSDIDIYMRALEWHYEVGSGVANPLVTDAKNCPDDCGMCNLHISHTVLANVDLTNRCNLSCPICFANANVQDYIYEPSFDEVKQMLQNLRDQKPVAGRVVQFSGGEPTLHPDWFKVLSAARDMGFVHVQCATNGIKFANDDDFAERSKEAGLHTLYLQFDGFDPALYKSIRGRENLLDLKLKAVENVRKAGLKIVYVPTIVNGENDDQVVKIFQFALDNIDVSSGISFQPVAITGRIDEKQREHMRFTLSDLALRINELGYTTKADWFPLSCTSPISQLLSAFRGEMTCHITCHPLCGIGTYFFVDQNKKPTPITRFVDIKDLLDDIQKQAERLGNSRFKTVYKFLSGANVLASSKKFFNEKMAPEGLSFTRFLQTIEGLVDKNAGRGKNDGTYTYKTLMVAGMHFMDSYNYDVERVKRCVIHYSAPDGRLYPFCAYNSGLVFREAVERKFSIPKSEYRQKHTSV